MRDWGWRWASKLSKKHVVSVLTNSPWQADPLPKEKQKRSVVFEETPPSALINHSFLFGGPAMEETAQRGGHYTKRNPEEAKSN